MLEQKTEEQRENAFKEIDNMRFPIINIRRTSNLAIAPVNTFGLALSLFMLSLPLTEWCKLGTPIVSMALMAGGLCQYIVGIYDWYQGKTIQCFVDFIFGLLNVLIYYCNPINTKFESYIIGTFFVLYLVILLALGLACKNKGIIHLVNIGLLILADILVLTWQFIYNKNVEGKNGNYKRVKKSAGYFLFFASLSIWCTGVGRLINDIFQNNIIQMIIPDL